MKNIYFVFCAGYIEYYVNGKLISDCFTYSDDILDLIDQLHEFANVPIYKELNNVDDIIREREEN